MGDLLVALAATDVATTLRTSRWLYASVNTAHVLGIALLVGAIVPLDLRLIGLWQRVPRDALIRALVPTALVGLALALTTGTLLFSVRAAEYAAITIFLVKLGLIATAVGTALAFHVVHGRSLQGAGRRRLALAGTLSLACWLGALVAGRMVAYVGD
ncbi:MAG: hypothetical protein QNJ91_09785 [Gammaproteobacteria bacterium]|nr:hypothetical protein [Gammaproteobacteria bacterium]